jgi:hypothetical protein
VRERPKVLRSRRLHVGSDGVQSQALLPTGAQMKANALSLLALFQEKQRLEVPIYKRKYVWNEEEQWEPLWQDISRKFTERL